MASFIRSKLKGRNKSVSTDKESYKQPKCKESLDESAMISDVPVSTLDSSESAALILAPLAAPNADDEVCGEVTSQGPTVEVCSIFTGLQLSNKVAKDEASDSPYMQKATTGNREGVN